MPAHASRTLAPAHPAPPGCAERRLLAPAPPGERRRTRRTLRQPGIPPPQASIGASGLTGSIRRNFPASGRRPSAVQRGWEPSFARPGEGHDKGGVESRGRGVRLQVLTPVPRGDSLPELSEQMQREVDRLASERVWERFAAEQPALRPLPEVAFEARRLQPVSVSRSALVRVEGAWYSVPERWAGLSVTAWLGVEEVTLRARPSPPGSPHPAQACCASAAPSWRSTRRWSASPRASAPVAVHPARRRTRLRPTARSSTPLRPPSCARRPRGRRRAGRRFNRPSCRDSRCAPPPGCSASHATPSGGTSAPAAHPGARVRGGGGGSGRLRPPRRPNGGPTSRQRFSGRLALDIRSIC